MTIHRALSDIAFSDSFGRQMRFISGPRQCGKTTFSKIQLIENNCAELYYNWDFPDMRKRYLKEPSFLTAELLNKGTTEKRPWVCFDEIHKITKWKDILKGIFDSHDDQIQIIVTGSARLDLMRKSGDSLAGRYFLFHLNPLTLAETTQNKITFPETTPEKTLESMLSGKDKSEDMEILFKFSGFPEPFLSQNSVFAKKWRSSYLERLVREDIRDLSAVHMLDKIQNLISLLPQRIGAPLSINSLREDLELNHSTVSNYIRYLELTYALFNVHPFSRKGSRLNKKDRKVYFFDWTLPNSEADQFENFVAVHLKTYTDLWSDASGDAYKLLFVRTKDGLETDFLICKNDEPFLLFEVKLNDESIRSHHQGHRHLLGDIPFVQIIKKQGVLRTPSEGLFVISAGRLFT